MLGCLPHSLIRLNFCRISHWYEAHNLLFRRNGVARAVAYDGGGLT